MKTLVAIASFFAVAASAHGNITSPPARVAGSAMAQLCGANAVAAVEADGTISVEDLGTVGADCQYLRPKPPCDSALNQRFSENADHMRMQAMPSSVVELNSKTMQTMCSSLPWATLCNSKPFYASPT